MTISDPNKSLFQRILDGDELSPLEELQLVTNNITAAERTSRAPTTGLGHAIDFISRPLFASRQFVSQLEGVDSAGQVWEALKGGAGELIDPKNRLTSEDLLRQYSPEFAANNPRSAFWLGLGLDIATDPINLLSFGTGTAFKAGVKLADSAGNLVPISKYGQGLINNKIASGVSREAAERQVLAQAADAPRILDRGGLKVAGQTVLTADQFKKISGYNYVRNLPGINTSVDNLQKAFADVVEDFVLDNRLENHFPAMARFRRSYEARRIESLRYIEEVYDDIFGKGASGLNKESRTKIDRVLGEATRAATTTVENTDLATSFLGAGEDLASFDPEVFRQVVQSAGLNSEELTALNKLQQVYNHSADLTVYAENADDLIKSYHPTYYEATRDVAGFTKAWNWLTQRQTAKSGTHSEIVDFMNRYEDAFVNGAKPQLIEDAGRNLILRMKTVADENHASSLNDFFKSQFPDWDGKISSLPPVLRKDVDRLNMSYSSLLHEDRGTLLNILDRFTSVFRVSATVANPAFAARQAGGSTIQLLVGAGLGGVKFFDSIPAAARTLFGGAPLDVKDVYGNILKGDELLAEARDQAILKNISIEGVGQNTINKLSVALTNDVGKSFGNRSGALPANTAEAVDGIRRAIDIGKTVLNFPGHIEDFFRMSGFINARMNGNDVAAAAKQVDELFFNYSSALSNTERTIRDSILPFYTFTRFGAELAAKGIIKRPGNAQQLGNIGKGLLAAFSKADSDQELTPEERRVLPGFILEQPSVYSGFDDQQRAVFRTISGYNPLEVLNFVQFNEQGEFDAKETFTKSVLAAMVPSFKIPLEVAIDKELFTGRVLDGTRSGKLGDVDPEDFLTSLGFATGALGGATTAAAAGTTTAILANLPGAKEVLKKILSWEEVVDPQTGDRVTYINPYIMYSLRGLFPGFNSALRISNEDTTPIDDALQAVFGIATNRRDLAEDRRFKAISEQLTVNAQQKRIRGFLRAGRTNEADIAISELEKYLDFLAQSKNHLSSTSVRGRQFTQ